VRHSYVVPHLCWQGVDAADVLMDGRKSLKVPASVALPASFNGRAICAWLPYTYAICELEISGALAPVIGYSEREPPSWPVPPLNFAAG
jgi:hypothetical protein